MNDSITTNEITDRHTCAVLEYDRILAIVASHAQSAQGRDRILKIVPRSDRNAISDELAEASELMDALRFDDPLPGIDAHDLREMLPLLDLDGYHFDIEDIAFVADNLDRASDVRRWFDDRSDKYPRMHEVIKNLALHNDLVRDIRRIVTPDHEIADDATPALRSIRRKLENARASLRSLVEKALERMPDDILSERVVTIRNGRYVIPVRDNMKGKVSGVIQDRSQTGRTLFIEPMASIESNNEVRELELAEQAEVYRIIDDLSRRLREIGHDIAANQHTLMHVDDRMARARYGVTVEGSVPTIHDRMELVLHKARHPLLDWRYRHGKNGRTVVPLDMTFGGETRTVVVTGPNAGGKTVALKTVGLLTLMALSGLPVPAGENTAVFVPQAVLADIGDEQSIEDDLSTYSSHMKHMVEILERAGEGAIVLLDELGGATNPADGEAIGLAVLETLTGRGTLTLATTHLGGLKVFAHETEGVSNASMEFDTDHLRPTFAFRMGIPGSSYAFDIASRMGMPRSVLRRAEELGGGERKTLEGLIAEMEEHVRRADEEARKAQSERIDMEHTRRKYDTLLSELRDRRDDMMREAVNSSEEIMNGANRSIEAAIRSIKESAASTEAVREARKQVETAKENIHKKKTKLRKKKREAGAPVENPEKGMHIYAPALSAKAVIEEVLDDGRKVRIRMGTSKASLVVATSGLEMTSAPQKQKAQRVSVKYSTDSTDSMEIDLRGMTFDEAKDALDIFIDRLTVAGFEIAHIIHGKGTGALRKKLEPYLDRHPAVLSRRLGAWNEGSSGVTVVTLKK